MALNLQTLSTPNTFGNSMKKWIKRFIVLGVLIFIASNFIHIGYVAQNQLGFKYNVSSGKPVSPENNPLLPFGYVFTIGWNERLFIINAEVNNYNFTAASDANSPYDESLTWDSVEGVTMAVNYTILGRVTDPWKFYNHFGRPQHSYAGVEGIQDEKIYEAIRMVGHYVNVRMGEVTQQTEADKIRQNPAKYTEEMTADAAHYAEQFGFTITDVIFPDRFTFPGGNTIQTAREMLQAANSDVEKLKNEKKTAEQERDEAIANAKIESDQIIGEGQQEADKLLSEARALGEQLQSSIYDVGIEGTMQITMSKMQGKLMKQGVIEKAILTEDSIFGMPFYQK